MRALLAVLLVAAPVSARLSGFHTDIESCDGDVNDGQNRSAELALCNAFFGTLANISATLKQANALLPAGAEPFILTADAGTSWTCHEGGATEPCYAVPWAGSNKSVAEHLLDIVDVRTFPRCLRALTDCLSAAVMTLLACMCQRFRRFP
eukprot:COSAG02_NODE_1055_length_14928_cov_67.022726_4_plen_150_part_00